MKLAVERLTESQEAQSYINNIGLPETDLRSALEHGIYEYKRSTDLHPLTDAGFRTWSAIVYGLRTNLLSQEGEWNYKNEHGMPLTFNRKHCINLIVTSGDADTGRVNGCPATKNKKGAATESLVGTNLSLFDDILPDDHLQSNIIDPNQTWILLYHFDYKEKEVRAELSLPNGISQLAGGIKVTSWQRRILLEPIPLDQQLDEIYKPDFVDDIDFDITKKSSNE